MNKLLMQLFMQRNELSTLKWKMIKLLEICHKIYSTRFLLSILCKFSNLHSWVLSKTKKWNMKLSQKIVEHFLLNLHKIYSLITEIIIYLHLLDDLTFQIYILTEDKLYRNFQFLMSFKDKVLKVWISLLNM